jgi:ribosomal subunit interface protein
MNGLVPWLNTEEADRRRREEPQMDVVVRGLNINVSQATCEHAERRFEFALERFSYHLPRTLVRLSDINGRRGGIDKRCQVSVRATGLPPIWIEEIDADLYAAVDRAADRVGQIMSRAVERRAPVRTVPRLWHDEEPLDRAANV